MNQNLNYQQKESDKTGKPKFGNNGIYFLDILCYAFSAITLIILAAKYETNLTYPNLTKDAYNLLMKGTLGLFIMLLIKTFQASLDEPQKRRNTRKQKPMSIITAQIDLDKLIIGSILAIASYLLIQIIPQILVGQFEFQSVAGDVYAFYTSSAIMEEFLYRGGLITGFYFMISFFLNKNSMSNELIDKTFLVLIIIISAIIFMIAHERYYNDVTTLIITLLGGISQGFFYVYTKSLTPAIIAHGVINFIAAGSLIQSLGVI
jgi:membrane protease YdiL (CAAX protease family)